MRYRLSSRAQNDVLDILEQSERRFGIPARLRYKELIFAALRDISRSPERPGSVGRADWGENVRLWHLRQSRDHVPSGVEKVKTPRHVIVYRIDADVVIIGRILHEAMEMASHLRPEQTWH